MRTLFWNFIILIFFAVTNPGWSQPACVECCCGDATEVGFPCGNFEEPPFAAPGGWIDYGAGQTYCGWTVVSGSISIHHGDHNNLGAGNPNGSSQHLDLNGSSPGTIERTLTGLIPGSQYTITLWYAAHNGAGTATARMLINNGAWLDATWSTNIPGSQNWEFLCLSFLADAPTAVIRLIGSSNNPCCGMLIDDMSMWACDPDAGPPVADNPPPALIQMACHEPVPQAPVLSFSDDCDSEPDWMFEELNQPQPCYFNLVRIWTATDACGQTTSLQQVIEVRDTEAPYFLKTPTDREVPCGSDVLGEFYAWIQTNGGAIAEDLCDQDPEWTISFDQEPAQSCGEVEVTFIVSDQCGNTTEAMARFRVVDQNPPVLVEPARDHAVFCAPSPSDSLAAWLSLYGGALAVDPCQPLIWSHDFNGDSLAPVLTVTFTATDGCGQTVSTTATFSQIAGNDTLNLTAFACDPILVGADTLVVGNPGCETVTITITTLLPSDTLRLSQFVCDPLLIGSDTLRLQNQAGCDSLIITSRVLASSEVILVVMSTCDPSMAGTDTLLLANQNGCDSIVITEIVFNQQYQAFDTHLLCGEGTPYLDTLVVTGGPCDSLFITQYLYRSPDTTLLFSATCDAAQVGQFLTVLQGSSGCDSLLISTVSLLPRDTVLVEGVTCREEEEVFEVQQWSNHFGCDSLVLVSILYIGVDTSFISRLSCDSTQVGTQVLSYPLAGTPCDSVVVETVTWAPQSVTLLDERSCAPTGPSTDTLLFTSQNGCDSLVVRRFQYTNLQTQLNVEPEGCFGQGDGLIRAEATSGGQSPYRYRLNGVNWQTQPSFGSLSPGSYTLEIEDAEGCSRSYPGLVIGSGQIAVVDIGPDREVDPGAVVALSAQSAQVLSQWQWSASDPLSCAHCPQTELGPVTQSQAVTVSVLTAEGCPAADALRITLRRVEEGLPAVYIPNSFSPNGDGINDLFSVFGNELVLEIRRLAVYDRWGNALYEETGIPPNAPSRGWDGSFRGRPMDPGVYVYVAEVVFSGGRMRLYKGDVTLMR